MGSFLGKVELLLFFIEVLNFAKKLKTPKTNKVLISFSENTFLKKLWICSCVSHKICHFNHLNSVTYNHTIVQLITTTCLQNLCSIAPNRNFVTVRHSPNTWKPPLLSVFMNLPILDISCRWALIQYLSFCDWVWHLA